MHDLPAVLVRNVVDVWGAGGERWLAGLPDLLREVADDWRLHVGAPYRLTFHWVAPVTRDDGSPAVLKLGVPGEPHLAHEAAALEAFDGRGAVRLLAHEPASGALLLERTEPGTPAGGLVPDRDADATAAAVEVLRTLHRPPPPAGTVKDLEDESASFADHLRRHPDGGALPASLVARAGELFDELCATVTRRVLLHGDLHHDNVLRSTRAPWLAIDPHGVVGDPGYDVGALLYNPDPQLRDDALLALVPARLEALATGLGLPYGRAVAWGFVQGVLSEVWTAQAGSSGPPGRALDVARLLSPRLAELGW